MNLTTRLRTIRSLVGARNEARQLVKSTLRRVANALGVETIHPDCQCGECGPARTFECENCHQDVPYCRGACSEDEYDEWCDDCRYEAEGSDPSA